MIKIVKNSIKQREMKRFRKYKIESKYTQK